MSQQFTAPTIEPAPREQRHQALQLMRLGAARIERLLAAACSGKIDMQGLYRARRDDTLVGVGWGQLMPGHAAFCWPAHLAAGEPESTAELVQKAVDQYLDAAGTVITQAILPNQDVVHAVRLNRARYKHLADLNYFVKEFQQSPDEPHSSEPPPSDLSFISGKEVHQQRLRELIDRTYEKTLDCAALNGIRSTNDVLTGYRHTGDFRAEWWIIGQYNGQDVGCVLLADHPEHEQCELMYLGIVPEMRGRGWGCQLTQYAQWIAAGASLRRMVLAVDDANWPARQLYNRMGFQLWDRRSVYVRTAQLDGSAAPLSSE